MIKASVTFGLAAICFFSLVRLDKIQTTPPDLPSEVATGDIVFVRGYTLRAEIVRILSGKFAAPVHVGVIRINNGMIEVIHADPRAPNQDAAPGVLIEPWSSFAFRGRISGGEIYRARTIDGSSVAASASAYAVQHIPFDYKFDWDDRSALYCTELIEVAFETEGVDLISHLPTTPKIVQPIHLMSSNYLKHISTF